VCLTRFVKAASLFILVAPMIRSRFKLSTVWSGSCLSQRRTQIRWAASDVRIGRSLVAPCYEREGPSASARGELAVGVFKGRHIAVDAANVIRLPKTHSGWLAWRGPRG
jgi:hypothetical protein